jgi:hypothetical protein
MSSEVNTCILKLMVELDMKVSEMYVDAECICPVRTHSAGQFLHSNCDLSCLCMDSDELLWIRTFWWRTLFILLSSAYKATCSVLCKIIKPTDRNPNHRAITDHLNCNDCQPFLPTFSGTSYCRPCMVGIVHRESNSILVAQFTHVSWSLRNLIPCFHISAIVMWIYLSL